MIYLIIAANDTPQEDDAPREEGKFQRLFYDSYNYQYTNERPEQQFSPALNEPYAADSNIPHFGGTRAHEATTIPSLAPIEDEAGSGDSYQKSRSPQSLSISNKVDISSTSGKNIDSEGTNLTRTYGKGLPIEERLRLKETEREVIVF